MRWQPQEGRDGWPRPDLGNEALAHVRKEERGGGRKDGETEIKRKSKDCLVPIVHAKSSRSVMTKRPLFWIVPEWAPQAFASVPPGSTKLVHEWPSFKHMNTLDLVPEDTCWPRNHPPPLYSFTNSTNIYACPLRVRLCLRCRDFLRDTSQFSGSTYSRKRIFNTQMNLRRG